MRYTPKQYARAVRAAVGTAAEFHTVIDELNAAAVVFSAHAAVTRFLVSHTVSVADRATAFERVLGGALCPIAARTLLLLMRNGQFRELSAVVRVAGRMVDTEEGIARVSVVSAPAIPDAARRRIESAIADRFHKRVTTTYTEEASVLAGLRVITDESACWDGTTAGKLQKLAACLAAPTTSQP